MDSIIYRTILSKKQYDEQIRGTASLARVRIIFIGYLARMKREPVQINGAIFRDGGAKSDLLITALRTHE